MFKYFKSKTKCRTRQLIILLFSVSMFVLIYSTSTSGDKHYSKEELNIYLNIGTNTETLNNSEKNTSYGSGLNIQNGVCGKGKQPWENEWLISEMKEFIKVYDSRIGDNWHGTPIMHQFALWSIIRLLKPKHVIESGIWHGLGTWIIRKAAPNAQLIMLDPNRRLKLHYVDRNNDTIYLTKEKFRDFGTIRHWAKEFGINLSETLAFIDDHNTPFKRIPQAARAGIRHMIFEDNYWLGYSDCLSLKQGCACLMKEPECEQFRYKDNWSLTNRNLTDTDLKQIDAVFGKRVKIYKEFPMMWNLFREGMSVIAERSTNYLLSTTDGETLLRQMGMQRLPIEKMINGSYTYFNIAYVELY